MCFCARDPPTGQNRSRSRVALLIFSCCLFWFPQAQRKTICMFQSLPRKRNWRRRRGVPSPWWSVRVKSVSGVPWQPSTVCKATRRPVCFSTSSPCEIPSSASGLSSLTQTPHLVSPVPNLSHLYSWILKVHVVILIQYTFWSYSANCSNHTPFQPISLYSTYCFTMSLNINSLLPESWTVPLKRNNDLFDYLEWILTVASHIIVMKMNRFQKLVILWTLFSEFMKVVQYHLWMM